MSTLVAVDGMSRGCTQPRLRRGAIDLERESYSPAHISDLVGELFVLDDPRPSAQSAGAFAEQLCASACICGSSRSARLAIPRPFRATAAPRADLHPPAPPPFVEWFQVTARRPERDQAARARVARAVVDGTHHCRPDARRSRHVPPSSRTSCACKSAAPRHDSRRRRARRLARRLGALDAPGVHRSSATAAVSDSGSTHAAGSSASCPARIADCRHADRRSGRCAHAARTPPPSASSSLGSRSGRDHSAGVLAAPRAGTPFAPASRLACGPERPSDFGDERQHSLTNSTCSRRGVRTGVLVRLGEHADRAQAVDCATRAGVVADSRSRCSVIASAPVRSKLP